ncbi:hypothetical protein Poli38472_009136 [Pythium oligandrum]|uniref:Uncharacterized protein n=1 Tax=Pythium oligandrum TaxID=41045 RepID=A0A8K1CKY4_PYTOL|nr:hypothetical protein Poli38472_009136 [Pythium oligandrum]|eukprot:TMW64969.1 hypothetical protein Poli38472_009136 [Pythium oligandrum]
MGITGSLIPDFTPRYEEPALVPSHSQQQIALGERLAVFSRARSRTSSGSRSLKSSRSSSSLSSSSSLRSVVRLQDVQELLESQSRLLKEKTDVEIVAMRHALQDEARKREEAERKIHFLCEKLGIEDTS